MSVPTPFGGRRNASSVRARARLVTNIINLPIFLFHLNFKVTFFRITLITKRLKIFQRTCSAFRTGDDMVYMQLRSKIGCGTFPTKNTSKIISI